MPSSENLWTTTAEYAGDDAGYAWWCHAHPGGYVLAVRARRAPVLHRAVCAAVDRARHPGRLRAAGSRQICAESKPALRAWLARELPPETATAGQLTPGLPTAGAPAASGALLARCPTCGP